MKAKIKEVIAIILSISIFGCSTITKTTLGSFDSMESKKEGVIIEGFTALRTRGALFAQGKLKNLTGNNISKVEIEARGYDKNNKLISTDRIQIAQQQIKNKASMSFSMTFVENVDAIDKYYFFGKYEITKNEIKVNWATLGVVLLAAATVVAISAAAYYGGYPSQGYSENINVAPYQRIQQPQPYNYSAFQSSYTIPKQVISTGGPTGKFNPSNPLSEYSNPSGLYNPSNPLSEFTSPTGRLNPNNPLSEISNPMGKYNPSNPLSEITSPTGSLNPSNPLSEITSPTGKFNPSNPLSEGIHPYYYYKRYLKKDN